ncbi:hypothetical protein MMPV_002798 [Pyropia vietnamensis]
MDAPDGGGGATVAAAAAAAAADPVGAPLRAILPSLMDALSLPTTDAMLSAELFSLLQVRGKGGMALGVLIDPRLHARHCDAAHTVVAMARVLIDRGAAAAITALVRDVAAAAVTVASGKVGQPGGQASDAGGGGVVTDAALPSSSQPTEFLPRFAAAAADAGEVDDDPASWPAIPLPSPPPSCAAAAASPLLRLLLLFLPSWSSPTGALWAWDVAVAEAHPALAAAASAPALALGTAGARAAVDTAWLGEAAADAPAGPRGGLGGTADAAAAAGLAYTVWVPLLTSPPGEAGGSDSNGGSRGSRSSGGVSWSAFAYPKVTACVDADSVEASPPWASVLADPRAWCVNGYPPSTGPTAAAAVVASSLRVLGRVLTADPPASPAAMIAVTALVSPPGIAAAACVPEAVLPTVAASVARLATTPGGAAPSVGMRLATDLLLPFLGHRDGRTGVGGVRGGGGGGKEAVRTAVLAAMRALLGRLAVMPPLPAAEGLAAASLINPATSTGAAALLPAAKRRRVNMGDAGAGAETPLQASLLHTGVDAFGRPPPLHLCDTTLYAGLESQVAALVGRGRAVALVRDEPTLRALTGLCQLLEPPAKGSRTAGGGSPGCSDKPGASADRGDGVCGGPGVPCARLTQLRSTLRGLAVGALVGFRDSVPGASAAVVVAMLATSVLRLGGAGRGEGGRADGPPPPAVALHAVAPVLMACLTAVTAGAASDAATLAVDADADAAVAVRYETPALRDGAAVIQLVSGAFLALPRSPLGTPVGRADSEALLSAARQLLATAMDGGGRGRGPLLAAGLTSLAEVAAATAAAAPGGGDPELRAAAAVEADATLPRLLALLDSSEAGVAETAHAALPCLVCVSAGCPAAAYTLFVHEGGPGSAGALPADPHPGAAATATWDSVLGTVEATLGADKALGVGATRSIPSLIVAYGRLLYHAPPGRVAALGGRATSLSMACIRGLWLSVVGSVSYASALTLQAVLACAADLSPEGEQGEGEAGGSRASRPGGAAGPARSRTVSHGRRSASPVPVGSMVPADSNSNVAVGPPSSHSADLSASSSHRSNGGGGGGGGAIQDALISELRTALASADLGTTSTVATVDGGGGHGRGRGRSPPGHGAALARRYVLAAFGWLTRVSAPADVPLIALDVLLRAAVSEAATLQLWRGGGGTTVPAQLRGLPAHAELASWAASPVGQARLGAGADVVAEEWGRDWVPVAGLVGDVGAAAAAATTGATRDRVPAAGGGGSATAAASAGLASGVAVVHGCRRPSGVLAGSGAAGRGGGAVGRLPRVLAAWLPDLLTRTGLLDTMLDDEGFAAGLATLLDRPLPDLWASLPAIWLPTILAAADGAALERLASKLATTPRDLIVDHMADALAASYMLPTSRRKAALGLIVRAAREKGEVLLDNYASAVVTRLVTALGTPRASAARRALDSLSLRVPMGPPYSGTGIAGLLALHFMAVWESLNSALFAPRATPAERTVVFGRLDAVLRLVAPHLHLFVPKVMATLKLALDARNLGAPPPPPPFHAVAASARRGPPLTEVRALLGRALGVWATFLNTLGPRHASRYLRAICVVLVPHLDTHVGVIAPALRQLLVDGRAELRAQLTDIEFILKASLALGAAGGADGGGCGGGDSGNSVGASFHPDLAAIHAIIREELGGAHRPDDGDIGSALADVAAMVTAATREEAALVRRHTLDRAATLLRARRADLHAPLLSLSAGDDKAAPVVSSIAAIVDGLVAGCMDETPANALAAARCLGELGAIDPALLGLVEYAGGGGGRHSSSRRGGEARQGRSKFRMPNTRPTRRMALVADLLTLHLVPALRGGERATGGRRTVAAGYAIQELLRLVGCTAATPAAALALPRSRRHEVGRATDDAAVPEGVGRGGGGKGAPRTGMDARETGALAELAAAFWLRLPDHTALAVQPYLSTAYSYVTDDGAPGGAASGAAASAEPACVRATRIRGGAIAKTLWHVGVPPANWVCLLTCRLIDYLDRRGQPVPAAADARRGAAATAAVRGEPRPPPPREVLGPILRAARFVARYDYATALFLLPVVVTEVVEEDDLDVVQRALLAARAQPDAVCAGPACVGTCAPPDARPGRAFIAAEFSFALRGGGAECVQVVFHVLDALRRWREQARGQSVGMSSRRGGTLAAAAAAAAGVANPLAPFADLGGSSVVSLWELATAAAAVAAYPRALLYAEQHVRRRRQVIWAWSPLTFRDDSAAAARDWTFIQRLYAAMEEVDGLTGVAALRTASSLPEQLLDAEASGADEMALLLHQRSIAEAPADIGRQTGYFRCLAAMGHWETVLMHTELLELGRGVGMTAAGGGGQSGETAAVDAPARTGSATPESLRAVAAAFGVEAAWRLGRWDRLADEAALAPPQLAVKAATAGVATGGATHPWGLAAGAPAIGDSRSPAGGGWEAAYQTAVGRMFVALRRRDAPALTAWADAARAALIGPASSAAANHYVGLYPYVRALHLVAEVEDALPPAADNGGRSSSVPRLGSLRARLDVTAPGLRCREPLLSARRVAAEAVGDGPAAAAAAASLAAAARDAGSLRVATVAAAAAAAAGGEPGALALEEATLSHAWGDTAGGLRVLDAEIGRLSAVVEATADALSTARPAQRGAVRSAWAAARTALGTAHLTAGRWVEASRSLPPSAVLAHYKAASRLLPGDEEPLYTLARYYDTLLRAAAKAVVHTPGDYLPKAARTRGAGSRAGSLEAGTLSSPYEYYPTVISAYAAALRLGPQHLFQALPRMLTLWFQFYEETPEEAAESAAVAAAATAGATAATAARRAAGRSSRAASSSTAGGEGGGDGASATLPFPRHNKCRASAVEPVMHDAVASALQSLPRYMWMTAIPQLLSRVLHPNDGVRANVAELLAVVLATYPDQALWHILPVGVKVDEGGRHEAINGVLSAAVRVAGAGGDSTALGAYGAGGRLPPGVRPPSRRPVSAAGADARDALVATLTAGRKLLRELLVVCETVPAAGTGRSHLSRKLLPTLAKLLPIDVLVPTQAALTVTLPGAAAATRSAAATAAATAADAGDGDGVEPTPPMHVPFAGDDARVTFVSLEESVLVMASLMKPKRVGFWGSDGHLYRFLFKREERGDMRKDARLMEFNGVVNRLLRLDAPAAQRRLRLRTYAVLPLTDECGLLEWVEDVETLRSVVNREHADAGYDTSSAELRAAYESYEMRKLPTRQFFEEWALPRLPPILHRFFLRRFLEPSAWLAARTRWTRSAAVWSMTGYVVGLGDRHGENILVDATTGECVHVDFACLFERGRTLKIPEVVPFRLTPNVVDGMGVLGVEGPFRVAAETALRVLRTNREALMCVLETFLHDPLVEWTPTRSSSTAAATSGITLAERAAAARRVQLAHAVRTLKVIDLKLLGVEGGGLPLSVDGQVRRLINEAASPEKLASMYIWWMGFL